MPQSSHNWCISTTTTKLAAYTMGYEFLPMVALLVSLLTMAVLWRFQEQKKEADIVDVGWTVLIGAMAVWFALTASGDPLRKIVIGTIAFIWSVRLATHLYLTRVRAPGEDGRYSDLRQSWKENSSRRFFIFFQIQAVLAFLFALPFYFVTNSAAPLNPSFALSALTIFLISVIGESLADSQLERFRSDEKNKGEVCRQGLWRYSRHPNYFFEWLHWVSYIPLSFGTEFVWLSSLPAIIILYLVLRVTGIPPTEARSIKSRGDKYIKYQREVSAFLPWFPKELK